MAQSQSLTLHNDSDYATFIERNLPFVDLHSDTDTPWWTLPLWGNYSFGYDTGIKMARRLLAFYGSGQVKADNTYLTHIVASMMRRQEKLNKPDSQGNETQCLRGQYSGFFGTLSKFLAPAAFMNGCGMTEKNDFEPVRLPCPLVPAAQDQTVQQAELPLPVVPANGISTLTMSSREIAELTGKQHKDVMRDIRKMLDELNGRKVAPVEYTDKKGEKRPEYLLSKRETLILVSGYNIKLRARIIDRWQELEQAVANGTLQQTPAIGELAELREAVKRLEQTVTSMPSSPVAQPSVPDNNITVGELARQLHIGRNHLFRFLKQGGLLAKSDSPNPYFLKEGIFVKEEHASPDSRGYLQKWFIVRVTPKGQELVRNLLNRS